MPVNFENTENVSFEIVGAFRETNRFMVFQKELPIKGHFMLANNGTLYRTILGLTFKVKHPERYEVRFIAEQVD